jgi:diguanylate cyclase (GGDEF)-like protein
MCLPTPPVRALLTALLCWCISVVWAANAGGDSVITLVDTAPSTLIEKNIDTWIDVGSQATIEQVTAGTAKFQSTPALVRHALSSHDTLWIKLRLAPTGGSVVQWTLNVPTPSLDMVTLYQTDGTGRWAIQRAGDTLAQSEWHRSGLYPDFDLKLAEQTYSDIYLAIQNHKLSAVPLRLAPRLPREAQRLRELLGVALILGGLLSMTSLSVLRFAEHRKTIDGWAALFGMLVVVTIAGFAGVMNAYVWSASPKFGDVSASVLPVITVGCTLLFVRSIFAQHLRGRRFYRLTTWVGMATVASIVLFGILDRPLADRVCGAAMLVATVLSIAATYLGGRSGSVVARWLMIALAPQFLAEMYMFASGFDWVPFVWEMRYLMILTIALAVPVLLYALSQVTHDRKELANRANHLPTQDALTGLLTKDVFQTHLDESVARAIESREPIALVLVRVINHSQIRQAYGDTTAEHCLLRAVVKLQRILRDVDPAGRVGSAQFALLMEGVSTRQSVTERMVKLIASGLTPLPGLVPEVTLQFQAACVLLHENPVPAERVLGDLRDLLSGMSSNTRRPIRFLEALPTQTLALNSQSDSGLT